MIEQVLERIAVALEKLAGQGLANTTAHVEPVPAEKAAEKKPGRPAKAKEEPKAPVEQTAPKEETPKEPGKLTHDDLRKALSEVMTKKGMDVAKKILATVGNAATVSLVKAELIPAVFEAACKAVNEESPLG